MDIGLDAHVQPEPESESDDPHDPHVAEKGDTIQQQQHKFTTANFDTVW